MLKPVADLNFETGSLLYLDSDRINSLRSELEDFLKDEKDMNTLSFSKKVMLSQEIKNNNTIEGYLEDLSFIEQVIDNDDSIHDTEKKNRIINLYKGYKYILEGAEINKDSLHDLYSILSYNLLEEDDLKKMGPYYRNEDVFIHFSERCDVAPDKGVSPALVDSYMEKLFNYLNDDSSIDSMTDYYVKSQIAHFYFVYLHPYYDINGRTSRTVAMWYLLNNSAYPYIIFNRAIHNTKNEYYKEILKCKKNHNITSFISYLMLNAKKELEKEYVIQAIKSSTNEKLSGQDFYTLFNILSMNHEKTLKDFATFYNDKNDRKNVKDVHREMIEPLLDKDILVKIRDTSSKYDHKNNNFVFDINTKKLDLNREKIRRISI